MKNLKIYKRVAAFVLVTTQLITMSGCSNQTSNDGSTSAPTAITIKTTTTTTENPTTTTPSSQTTTTTTIPIFAFDDPIISNDKVIVYNSNFEISKELEYKINQNIKNFVGDCSFVAINLKDGMSFGCNVNLLYYDEDTLQLPFALYCCKQMDAGNGSLDEKVYEGHFDYVPEYSIKDLLKLTIINNDENAYYMLHDRFYTDSYDKFLKDSKFAYLLDYDLVKEEYIDAISMARVWQEIYKYKDESPNGKYLFELLTHAKYNFIKDGMNNYDSAHKSGRDWDTMLYYDSGIVFAEDDYIVVILSVGYDEYDNNKTKNQLIKISSNIEEVINEYTLYKQKDKEKQKTLTK